MPRHNIYNVITYTTHFNHPHAVRLGHSVFGLEEPTWKLVLRPSERKEVQRMKSVSFRHYTVVLSPHHRRSIKKKKKKRFYCSLND